MSTSGFSNSNARGKSASAGSHRGFAFVEYNSRKEAEKALTCLSASTHLYGRRLVLEWAKAEDENETNVSDSLYNKRKGSGSDLVTRSDAAAGQEKRFKKSNLNSSLRSKAGTGLDPLDAEPLDA
jgi:RNA recognition motif-containing protein